MVGVAPLVMVFFIDAAEEDLGLERIMMIR